MNKKKEHKVTLVHADPSLVKGQILQTTNYLAKKQQNKSKKFCRPRAPLPLSLRMPAHVSQLMMF